MYYITIVPAPWTHQMTLEELFESDYTWEQPSSSKGTGTRTYERERISAVFSRRVNMYGLKAVLDKYNDQTQELREADRHSLYSEFFIPKKSGGLRKIDAPNDELKAALRTLKTIFEKSFGALYHNNAYAYIAGRSTITALKKHQQNESKWYAKFDLSNFFGSVTKEYVLKIMESIFPFNYLAQDIVRGGRETLSTALDLCFLDGGLPQGTPISPMLTNLIMIPVDYKLSKALNSIPRPMEKYPDNTQHMVYTRYADDFIISSALDFDPKKIEGMIVDVLTELNAPFSLKPEKTRYGSTAGRNWNFGLMITKDNKLTIGNARERQFKTMLFNYLMDRKNGKSWPITDIQTMEGLRAYYSAVEGDVIDAIIKHVGEKAGCPDPKAAIKEDLRC